MMKRYIYLLVVLTVVIVSSCKEEHDDVRPGIYLTQKVMESFPGDTLIVSGQASNYVGLQSIRLTCDAWGIDQLHDFSGEDPKVMEFNYRVPVPEAATFDQTLMVTVTDVNGLENRQIVQLLFAPDTQSPSISGIRSYTSVEYDLTENKGLLNLSLTCSDDRKLSKLNVRIPAIGYD